MLTRHDLPDILLQTLQSLGGKGTIIEVCREVWNKYENQLRNSNDLFYTWQYDIRWAATTLRKNKKMRSAEISPSGVWEIS